MSSKNIITVSILLLFSLVFYSLLKLYARLAIRIYCRRIVINKPEVLKRKGPLLLAANHPNSFLDGIILTTLFEYPVYSLARGDAFKNKGIGKVLRWLRLLPVYRTSEGVENLEHNYTSFAACREVFLKGETVLIFSEGRCENEWHLRPLKKGTARLAISSWQAGIPLEVIPVALNYSSFKNFGKELHLFFGEKICAASFNQDASEGKQLLGFNEKLYSNLKQLVYEINEKDTNKVQKTFSIKKNRPHNWLLFLPFLAGVILHAPLFLGSKLFTDKRFKHSGHYDSVMASILLLAYPVYLLALFLLACFIQPLWGVVLLLLLPFTAWATVQVKVNCGW